MSETADKQILEAAIFASVSPLDMEKLKSLVDGSADDIKTLIKELQADYEGRGVELVKVASGYRFQAREEYALQLKPLYEKSPPRYSKALLETLALVAYRQPITRGEIEQVRGVAVSTHIMKTLQEREWVKIVGARDVPGKPALFATTKQFLDYFNLRTLSDLPALSEVADFDKAEEKLNEQLNLAVHPAKAAPSEGEEQVQEELVAINESASPLDEGDTVIDDGSEETEAQNSDESVPSQEVSSDNV